MNNINKQKINRETIEEIYELNLKSSTESIRNGIVPFGFITIVDIALNPNTPKEVLSFLSNHEREEVRASVALNPNTPIDILENLKDEFPYYIVENPTTPINTLKEYVEKRITEKKDLSKQVEIDKLIRVPSEIAGLSNETKVMQIDPLGRIARGIARNPNAPKDLLEKLANDPLEYVRQAVAANPNTPIESLEQLANEFQHEVAANPSTPPYLLEEIAKTNPYQLAISPNTPGYLLEQLADIYPYQVAANPNTPPHILKNFTYHYHNLIASNPNTPSDFLEELADKYPYEVASNPSTPGDLLKRLFKKAPYQVAANHNTPIDLLEQLITHPDFLVRKFLAKNPKMSGELLKRLYESKTKNVLYNYINEDEETLLNELATNPNTPGEVLKEIVEEIEKINFEEVKITESEKNSQTSDWQKIIFDEESKDHFIIKLNLAIDNIIKRKDFILATAININLDYLEMILTTTKIIRLEEAMNKKKQNEFIKLAIILNPITPKEFLEKLTTDKEEIIRMAATKVLNLPKEPKESTPKRRTKKKPQ